MFHPEAAWLKAAVNWGLGSTVFEKGGGNETMSEMGAYALSPWLLGVELERSCTPPQQDLIISGPTGLLP